MREERELGRDQHRQPHFEVEDDPGDAADDPVGEQRLSGEKRKIG